MLLKHTLLFIILSLSIVFGRMTLCGANNQTYPIPSTPGTITYSWSQSNKIDEQNTKKTLQKIKIPIVKIQKNRFELPWITEDKSIYRFVSRSTPLSDKDYEPSSLMSISWPYINEAGRRSSLRIDAKNALWELAQGFYNQFHEPLIVISWYRSAAYQQRLWNLGRCTDSLCAPPGHSEHQLGLAVDLFDATTEDDFLANGRYRKYVTWLQANAHLYGWHQSYQKWEAVDEYEVEPWHWRYIWVDMATRLKNLGWTYTEYVRFNDTMLGW